MLSKAKRAAALYGFPFGSVIVVSLIQTPEAFERGLKRLESLLAES